MEEEMRWLENILDMKRGTKISKEMKKKTNKVWKNRKITIWLKKTNSLRYHSQTQIEFLSVFFSFD